MKILSIMKILFPFILLTSLLFAFCNDAKSQNEIPVVQSGQTYDVVVKEDIVYAEALSHDSINSANATTIPLKLDVYVPDNELENRPAYMFIHGGGFKGGSKQQSHIINLANYYASRGWVFISIDYRLKKDNGTVPEEWVDGAKNQNVPIDRLAPIYPAQRDAKAALRWIVGNADTYNINTNYISVGGASAGAITAITIGISNPEDFRDEIDTNQDPTLASTNLEQSYQIRTIVDLWGSKVALDINEKVFGHHRFDSNDPSLFIAHGTDDPLVPFSSAEDLKSIYEANGVPLAYYPLEGAGHGAWGAKVKNKSLAELSFDFIVEQQNLIVK
ncbi:MAG: alpha/beta hydrolase [Flavobacteriaceae bacterium]